MSQVMGDRVQTPSSHTHGMPTPEGMASRQIG